MTVLSINHLTKSYGDLVAVKDLSLDIHAGTIYGLLGPNGSGKTTTLGIILDIIRADNGMFEWFGGEHGRYYRKKIGAILETPNFYPYLTAEENLKIVDLIKGGNRSNFDDLLQLVDLHKRKKTKFRAYSLGMKQRLAIAATLLEDPEVLIFDEPTNGLDPQGIAEVRNIIQKIAGIGKTVIFASHILHEVEKICTHVAIIKKGTLLATGNVGSILSDDVTIEVGGDDLELIQSTLSGFNFTKSIILKGEIIECEVASEVSNKSINEQLIDKGIIVSHLVRKHKDLEQEFLEITKEEIQA